MSDPAQAALPIVRLRRDAVVPGRAHRGDAGLDLAAVEGRDLAPGARAPVPTGLAIAVPEGHAGLVLPRSGLARRHGVTVVNAPGLIDSGYRGEIQVLLVNLGEQSYAVRPGDRIAQLVIAPVAMARPTEVAELPRGPDDRSGGGFGSSGR